MKSIEGFPPIENDQVQVLILGSMPSVISLQKQQYYGHHRNAFWPIMMGLFTAPTELDYQQRKRILLQHRVAVWDVLKSCYRQGSMDADILSDSVVVNDFATFFEQHTELKCVFFNGGMAEKYYKKHVLPGLAKHFQYLHYRRLPSTSPAYAAMSLAEKRNLWGKILNFLLTD